MLCRGLFPWAMSVHIIIWGCVFILSVCMHHVHRKVNAYITLTVCGYKRLYELLESLSIPVCISLTVHIMCRTCGALCISPFGKNSPLNEWECEGGEVSPRHSTAIIHSTLYDRLFPTIAQSNTILTSTMNSC